MAAFLAQRFCVAGEPYMVGIEGYDAGQLLGATKIAFHTECSLASPTESFLIVEAHELENRLLIRPDDKGISHGQDADVRSDHVVPASAQLPHPKRRNVQVRQYQDSNIKNRGKYVAVYNRV